METQFEHFFGGIKKRSFFSFKAHIQPSWVGTFLAPKPYSFLGHFRSWWPLKVSVREDISISLIGQIMSWIMNLWYIVATGSKEWPPFLARNTSTTHQNIPSPYIAFTFNDSRYKEVSYLLEQMHPCLLLVLTIALAFNYKWDIFGFWVVSIDGKLDSKWQEIHDPF